MIIFQRCLILSVNIPSFSQYLVSNKTLSQGLSKLTFLFLFNLLLLPLFALLLQDKNFVALFHCAVLLKAYTQ